MAYTTVGNIRFDWLRTYRTWCNQTGNGVTALVSTKWTNTSAFEPAMLGTAGWSPSNKRISRSLPQQHPTKSWQYCTACNLAEGQGGVWESGSTGLIEFKDLIQPQGGPFTPQPDPLPPMNPGISYPNSQQASSRGDGYAYYEVTFEAPLYNILPDAQVDSYVQGQQGQPGIINPAGELIRYVFREKKRASENLELPGNGFKYLSDGKPILTSLIKLRPTAQLSYHWHWVPDPLYEAAIGRCVGRVNSYAFDGYPAQTLLCLSPDTEKIVLPDGGWAWNVTYHFLWRGDSTWNQIYRTKTNRFDGVVGINGDLYFGTSDFNNLFQAAPPAILPGDDAEIGFGLENVDIADFAGGNFGFNGNIGNA